MTQERRNTIRRQADRDLIARMNASGGQTPVHDPRGEVWNKEFRHKRRHAIRHNCTVHISLEIKYRTGVRDTWNTEQHPVKGRLLDLSADGASLFMAQPLEIGQGISLSIGLQDSRQILAKGAVRWTKGVEKRSGFASGVQFTQISAQDRQKIQDYLKELDDTIGL